MKLIQFYYFVFLNYSSGCPLPLKKRKIIHQDDIEYNKGLSYDQAVLFLDSVGNQAEWERLLKRLKSSKLYCILKIENTVYRKNIYNYSPKKKCDNKMAVEYLTFNLKKELLNLFFEILKDNVDLKIKKLFLGAHNIILEKVPFESCNQVIVLNSLRRLLIIGLCENYLYERHKDNPMEIYGTHYKELGSDYIIRSNSTQKSKRGYFSDKNNINSLDLNSGKFMKEQFSFLYRVLYLEYKIAFNKLHTVLNRFDNILNFYKTVTILNSEPFSIHKIYCLEPFMKQDTLEDEPGLFILIDHRGYKFNRVATELSHNLHILGKYKIIRPTFNFYNISKEHNVCKSILLKDLESFSYTFLDVSLLNCFITTLQIFSEELKQNVELNLMLKNSIYRVTVIKISE